MAKRISVTRENNTGRNTGFHDNYKHTDMSRSQFVKEIRSGNYSNYHVRSINGIDTPVSNPDKSKSNNLG